MRQESEYLSRDEYDELGWFLCSFNRTGLADENDRRTDSEIANDYALECKELVSNILAQADAFLKIKPWPWREMRRYQNQIIRLDTPKRARQWFEEVVGYLRRAYNDPNAQLSPNCPPPVGLSEQYQRFMDAIKEVAMHPEIYENDEEAEIRLIDGTMVKDVPDK